MTEPDGRAYNENGRARQAHEIIGELESLASLLEELGEHDAASNIRRAIEHLHETSGVSS